MQERVSILFHCEGANQRRICCGLWTLLESSTRIMNVYWSMEVKWTRQNCYRVLPLGYQREVRVDFLRRARRYFLFILSMRGHEDGASAVWRLVISGQMFWHSALVFTLRCQPGGSNGKNISNSLGVRSSFIRPIRFPSKLTVTMLPAIVGDHTDILPALAQG